MSKVVCPHCDGRGIEPGTGIEFTRADLDEATGDDYEERQLLGRAWAEYGERCKRCRGKNVVDRHTLTPDEDSPRTSWKDHATSGPPASTPSTAARSQRSARRVRTSLHRGVTMKALTRARSSSTSSTSAADNPFHT